jgi:hypothetical protein
MTRGLLAVAAAGLLAFGLAACGGGGSGGNPSPSAAAPTTSSTMPSTHMTSSGPTATAQGDPPLTPFQIDVQTAITNGLAYLDSQNAYSNPSSAGDAAGITTLALLEKRASGNPGDPPQGYNGASAADKTRLRKSVAYLVNQMTLTGFFAYLTGGGLSALTEYLASGGPEACKTPCTPAQIAVTPVELQNLNNTVRGTVDSQVDLALMNQRSAANGQPADFTQGYWCYYNGFCSDSSTSQYSALGITAAEVFYGKVGDPGSRIPKIKTALALARAAYVNNAAQGSDDTNCDNGWFFITPSNPALYPPGSPYSPGEKFGVGGPPGDPKAFGHGYHSGVDGIYGPSLQQTSSGMFVQLLGGGNINDATVQSYMRWVYGHYRYTDIGFINGSGNLGNSWPTGGSYFYYLWSSFKGIEFMTAAGIAPNPGNLTTTSYGTLDPTAAPVCKDRQLHLDPATVPRVPGFGAGGAGFYKAEIKSQYFDYAYTLLAYQCVAPAFNAGSFQCSTAGGPNNPGSWSMPWDGNSYALLVLQRATGVEVPTATLSSNLATQTAGKSVMLTWSSTNATSCAASGGNPGDGWTGNALATSGSLSVTESAAGPVTYTITCGAGGQTAQASTLVTWNAAVGPTASLSSNLATQTTGKSVMLTWSSTNTSSCAASGGKPGDGWTGNALATSGSLSVTESSTGPVTYTITCAGGGQTAQASTKVTWTSLLCDVDSNGVIDSRDISQIMKLIGSKVPPAPAAADFDGNGVISINDARNCALRCTLKNCAIPPG